GRDLSLSTPCAISPSQPPISPQLPGSDVDHPAAAKLRRGGIESHNISQVREADPGAVQTPLRSRATETMWKPQRMSSFTMNLPMWPVEPATRTEVAGTGTGAGEDILGFDFLKWERELISGGRVSWSANIEEDEAVMLFRRQQGAAWPAMGKTSKSQIWPCAILKKLAESKPLPLPIFTIP
ncbi:hypothetical protein ACLOJK_038654, partial [Asimina triloba]